MICEGDGSVLTAIKEKKYLMETKQVHDHIQPLVIFGGGLMKGAYGVGAALALDEMGFSECFSSIVGISSGAPIAGHFLAGSIQSGVRVVTEECCSSRFSNAWRFWNQVDTKYFMDIMENDAHKKIDVDKVLKKPTKLFFGVSEYKTGLPKLLKPDSKELFFKSMHASLTMQNVSTHRTYIDGVHYADGGFTKPHVVSIVLGEIQATHMLFITNNDKDVGSISRTEKIINRTIFRLRLNGAFVSAINARKVERDKAIANSFASDTPMMVVWGDGSVGSLERDPRTIASSIEASRTWWRGLLAD